eukprot:2643490-Amphidinium_carterae.1
MVFQEQNSRHCASTHSLTAFFWHNSQWASNITSALGRELAITHIRRLTHVPHGAAGTAVEPHAAPRPSKCDIQLMPKDLCDCKP